MNGFTRHETKTHHVTHILNREKTQLIHTQQDTPPLLPSPISPLHRRPHNAPSGISDIQNMPTTRRASLPKQLPEVYDVLPEVPLGDVAPGGVATYKRRELARLKRVRLRRVLSYVYWDSTHASTCQHLLL